MTNGLLGNNSLLNVNTGQTTILNYPDEYIKARKYIASDPKSVYGDILPYAFDKDDPEKKLRFALPNIPRSIARNLLDLVSAPKLGYVTPQATMGLLDIALPGALTGIGKPNVVRSLLGGAKDKGYKGNPKDALIVQHNLREDNLNLVDKIGGLPSPSLAISKIDDPLTNFGEITLIGKPEMAIPKARNPVYGSDAYTSRAPDVDFKLDKDAKKYVSTTFNTYEKVPEPLSKQKFYVEENQIYRDLIKDDYLSNMNIIAKFLEDTNRLPDLKPITSQNHFNSEIRKIKDNFDNQDYEDLFNWAQKEIKNIESKGNIKKEFFKGFTNLGNRKYAEATLENLVKDMKKGAGEEGFKGAGYLRSRLAPRFKSFAEVKRKRDTIIPQEKFNDIKNESSKLLEDLEISIQKNLGDDVRYSTIQDLAEDIVFKNPPYEYSKNLLPLISKETYEKADKLREVYKKLPTEYFEIKPRRGLLLSEFEGAIVPSDISKQRLKILEDAGIKRIHKYSGLAGRKAAFNKFYDQTFSNPYSSGLLGMGLETLKTKKEK